MMAAMMLPGALPTVLHFARVHGRALAAPFFAASYVAVWIAAGIYELTPFKRSCRRRCRETVRSGFELGIYCVGSSVGLMVVLVALGVMSLTWMAVIAALVFVQKLVPPTRFVDIPVAVAILTVGSIVLLS